MNILLISTSFPVSANGSEAAGAFVKDFAETLCEQGHNIGVIAPFVKQKPDSKGGAIRYFWFPVSKLPLSLLSPKKIQDWWPIVSTLEEGKRCVDRAVKSFMPDHIFALWALPSGHWARYAKKRYGVPYSIWALGSDIWSLRRVPVIKGYLATVLKDADSCFADGYQLADDVSSISNKDCEFLPSTRQLPVCGLPIKAKAPYRLCFLGRWHPNKGIDLLLEALQLLDDDDWDNIKAIRIAGGGPMEDFVIKKIRELNNSGRTVYLEGFKDKYGAAELLTWTDYVIVPSRIESVPVIFSDALQASRAVVSMPVGDLPDLIDRYGNGILSDEVSVQSLYCALKISLNKNQDFFNNQRFDVQGDFSLPNIANQFIKSIKKY